jgi:hypothetical protein
MFEEKYRPHVIGEWCDTIHYSDGTVEVTPWSRNKIVNGLNVIMGSMLKSQSSFKGINYWAIGSGASTWDAPALPEKADLKITGNCLTTGTITIALDGVAYNVSVTGGDTIAQIVTKVMNTTFTSWNIALDGTDPTLIHFQSINAKDIINTTFNANSKGITATVTTTQQGTAGSPRPEPLATDTGCVQEIFRKVILPENIKYVDPVTFQETDSQSNIIQITVNISETEGVGDWREFSIICGNATEALNSGIAMNHKTHGLLTKTNTMTVERRIRFTFINE